MQETLQKLRQLHQEALSELSQMKRRIRSFPADYTDECNECWQVGYEEASEEYENLVDDITKILQEVDIEETMNSNPVVSDKQQPLFAVPTHPATQYVTVSPEAKQRLIDERGLSEQDFIAPKTVLRKGDICKMTVDFQFSYRKVAWKDVTVLVTHVDGDWITVQHDNDEFACPAECLEKTGTCNPDSEVE